MKETVTLNRKEQTRAKALALLGERRCTAREAAELMGVSRRHLFRLKKAYREEGPGGLAHGNRGRRPAHAIAEDIRGRVIELAENGYFGYNHTHLHEELVAAHGITLSRRSLTRILRTAGLRSPRRRRPRRHRSRRERMLQEGVLVRALFREQEDAQGYLMLLRESVRKKGVPIAWYSDRHSIFRRNDKEPWTLAEELAGRREPTQVARALEELGINLILAHSPQAKGRVERCWGTLQDRLVKELRRASACTLQEANQVLLSYLPRYRARFAAQPAESASAYRPLPKRLDIDAICSFHYLRTVANDNTVRLEERLAQITAGPYSRSYAGCRVQLQERLDGSLVVLYQGKAIAFQEQQSQAPLRTRRRARGRELLADEVTIKPSQLAAATVAPRAPDKAAKPAPDHPWRRSVVTKSLSS